MMNKLKKLFRKKIKKEKRKLDDYSFNEVRANNLKKLNEILEKVSKYGINSLTKKEKEFLDEQSEK